PSSQAIELNCDLETTVFGRILDLKQLAQRNLQTYRLGNITSELRLLTLMASHRLGLFQTRLP
ncbi:MAG: hypothetical protein ACKPDM_19670, partial [Dolichospermum sp.]